MFDIGWSELLVIAVVAIVVIGPKDLPRALRSVGQWTGRLKRMASEFQGQFTEAIREAELDAVQRDIEEIGRMDPLADIRNAAAETGATIQRDLDRATTSPSVSTERALYPWEVASPDPAASPAPVVSDAATQPSAAVEQKS